MSKNRKAKRNKFLTIFGGFCGLCVAVGAFVLYGPWSGFRDFWITTAMTTMSHQYLATWIYSDETIDKVLAENTISEVEGTTDLDAVELKQYTAKPIYKNKYDEDVLTKDPDNDLYKVIHIEERTFDAYLVVLYDREKETDITSAVSTYNTKHDVHVFYVDLADGLNKKVISDRMNTNVKDASDLEVKNPSLLKITNKKIVESVDGKNEIIDYLNK